MRQDTKTLLWLWGPELLMCGVPALCAVLALVLGGCIAANHKPQTSQSQPAPTSQASSVSQQGQKAPALADLADDERRTLAGDGNVAAQSEAPATKTGDNSPVRISDGAAWVFWLAVIALVVILLILLLVGVLFYEVGLRRGKTIERLSPKRG